MFDLLWLLPLCLGVVLTPDALARFMAKVQRREPDECWPWTAGTDPSGYGKFKVEGKDRGAHRVAFEIANGEIAPGVVVMHRCDNPPCCNPGHLRPGTHALNNVDKLEKGRAIVASRASNRRAKLSDEDVAYVRTSPKRGIDLARELGVAKSTITFIRRGPTASYNRGKRERRKALAAAL